MNPDWQKYKKLELMSECVPEPQTQGLAFLAKLVWHFQRLSTPLSDTLTQEQQITHLDRCWKLEDFEVSQPSFVKTWQLVWNFLNQPLFQRQNTTYPEPKIRRIADDSGQVWWYAYDPMTGQNTYLETEEEARVWLEERFYP